MGGGGHGRRVGSCVAAGPAAAQGPSAGPVLPDAPSEQVKKPQQLNGQNIQPPEGATADVALKVLRDGSLEVTEQVTVPGGRQLTSRVPLKVSASDDQDRVFAVRDVKTEGAATSQLTGDQLVLTFSGGSVERHVHRRRRRRRPERPPAGALAGRERLRRPARQTHRVLPRAVAATVPCGLLRRPHRLEPALHPRRARPHRRRAARTGRRRAPATASTCSSACPRTPSRPPRSSPTSASSPPPSPSPR